MNTGELNRNVASENKKKIMMVFREGGENGGPYNSHKRITESRLKEKYEFIPLFVPAGHMGVFNPKLCKTLVRRIKSEKPDLIQCVGLELIGYHVVLAARFAGIKHILLAIHGSTSEAIEFNKNKLNKMIIEAIELFTLKLARYSFGVSDYVSGWEKVRKHAKNYMGTIYNLTEANKGKDINIRKELGIAKNKIVIVSTGRITKEKGFEIIADIVEKIDRDVVFLIVGDGAYLPEMKERLKEQEANGQVVFTGYRADIVGFLKYTDIFLMTSLHETLCMSLLEGGFAGLPLVATKVGGMREIVAEGINGYLINPPTAENFCEKLRTLIDDETVRKNMGRRSLELIEEKFSNEKILDKLDKVYTEILY